MSETPNDNTTPGPIDPVEAAQRRRRIPVWAIVLFPALLVWGVIYVNGVTKPPAATNTPEAMGASIYGTSCGGCHGANGEGGSGPAFSGGDLAEVFPEWEDQVNWVNTGSSNWLSVTGSKTFGATEKVAGAAGTMPGFGPNGDSSLSCSEILLVVRYERVHFAGIEPDEELEKLAEEIAAGSEPAEIPGCSA